MQDDTQGQAHYVIWTRSRFPLSPLLRSPRCARGNGFGPAVHCIPHVACERALCSHTGCPVFCLRSPQGPSLRRSGSVVFEALCYKLQVAGSIYLFLQAALGTRFYSASSRNEYWKIFPAGKAQPERKARNLSAMYVLIVYKIRPPLPITG
jgi:hypothetical protein